MRQVEASTGKTPLPLIPPEFPLELEYLWDYFLELSSTRPQGYSGPLPIPYSEIDSWVRLTGNTITPLEIETIKRLDRTYLKVVSNGRS